MKLLHAAHVPEGDGPFPTIIALHGWGANALDLLGLAPILHGGRALVLCPQGPLGLADPQSRIVIGHGWYPITRAAGRPIRSNSRRRRASCANGSTRRSRSTPSTAITSCCSASARAA